MWCEHWILNSDSKDPHEEPGGECMPAVPVQGCGWEGVGQWVDTGVSLKSAGSPDDSVSSGFSETVSKQTNKKKWLGEIEKHNQH